MINSIVKRHDRLNPLTQTQITIIRAAARLFLQNGYTKTSFKMIENESGVKVGNITYYFHSKEDLLKILLEELMDYHAILIDEIHEKTNDNVLTYAIEVSIQIALCENSRNVWDLYYSAYDLPQTYEYIKTWAAEKNYNLFHARLPEFTAHDFRAIEEVASGIEFAALKSVCNRNYTLDKKITIFLDSLLMLYRVPEEERKEVIKKVLALDYEKIAQSMFSRFIKRLDTQTSA